LDSLEEPAFNSNLLGLIHVRIAKCIWMFNVIISALVTASKSPRMAPGDKTSGGLGLKVQTT
jgi:hypothetical protein